MADPKGFLTIQRETTGYRAALDRRQDWLDVANETSIPLIQRQATRCMDCGVAFCHAGCPLGNLIPDFNQLVSMSDWREAYFRLSETNPFPEFTGKLCPAPCEDACVLSINDQPVTIKSIEFSIIERAFQEGWVRFDVEATSTGRSVTIVGSGPAGLVAAYQLCKAGHSVTVLERSDRLGGLIRYGVPDYKMAKSMIDLRINQLVEMGIQFKVGVELGTDVTLHELQQANDAVILCVGALKPRDLSLPGRELDGVRFAMEYLTEQNRLTAGDVPTDSGLQAQGKDVVILGGGDTGADCFGTAIRQGARTVTQLNHYPEPGLYEAGQSWPDSHPKSSSFVHEEGGGRLWGVQTVGFVGEQGKVTGVSTYHVNLAGKLRVPVPGSSENLPADLVLLAIGYERSEFGEIPHPSPKNSYKLDREGVFQAGDSRRGASLIVWAMADGMNIARQVDEYLMGVSSLRPASLP